MMIKAICMWTNERFVNLRYIPWYKFYLGRVSKDFTKDEISEISLNSTVYDFPVDQSAIEKEDMLKNIQEYLIKRNNIK